MVNINGGFKKIIGEKIVNGAILGSENNLYLEKKTINDLDYEKIDKNINYTKLILEYGNKNGINTLFVQEPDKYKEEEEYLPYNKKIYEVDSNEYWINKLSRDGSNILDLREEKYNADLFYKTDHHWTNEASLNAGKAILEEFGLESKTCDIGNYEKQEFQKVFLGSLGIKTGKYYIGKDNFEIFEPKFETDLEGSFQTLDGTIINKNGDFKSTFIDEEKLHDDEYNNKYSVFLSGGIIENIIINNLAENEEKLLVISDSFAKPMVQGLSLSFRETRFIDPQEGRYNKSCIEYIKEYKPDYIVVMYSRDYDENMIDEDFIKYENYLFGMSE